MPRGLSLNSKTTALSPVPGLTRAQRQPFIPIAAIQPTRFHEATCPRHEMPQAAQANSAEYRRDSRTPSPREGASRRDSYAVDPARASQDPRGKPQSPTDPREYIKSAPLSSSPTELEATASRYNSQRTYLAPPGAPTERVRTRSISFSASTRPTVAIPFNGAMPLPPPPPYSSIAESRNNGDYDRSRGERLSPSARPMPPAEFDRRRHPPRRVFITPSPSTKTRPRSALRPLSPCPPRAPWTGLRRLSSPFIAFLALRPHSRTHIPRPSVWATTTTRARAPLLRRRKPIRARWILALECRTGLKVMNPAPSPPPMAPVEPIPLPATEPTAATQMATRTRRCAYRSTGATLRRCFAPCAGTRTSSARPQSPRATAARAGSTVEGNIQLFMSLGSSITYLLFFLLSQGSIVDERRGVQGRASRAGVPSGSGRISGVRRGMDE